MVACSVIRLEKGIGTESDRWERPFDRPLTDLRLFLRKPLDPCEKQVSWLWPAGSPSRVLPSGFGTNHLPANRLAIYSSGDCSGIAPDSLYPLRVLITDQR